MSETEISADIFVKRAAKNILIDVRSPSEFDRGHIPGAVNIPVFNDEERERTGTLYKQKSHIEAVLYGLQAVGPKFSSQLEQILELKKKSPASDILIHCFRGGMRSRSVQWLVSLADIKAAILKGGYKAYRRYVLDQFKKPFKIILLSGETGCGKTAILNELKKNGEQVIDLENLANHKGSVFGGVGKTRQPTTQQFENNLAMELINCDTSKRLWVENESPLIGRIYLPKDLIDRMRQAPVFEISLPQNEREKRILREYGDFDRAEMERLIIRLKKYLGGKDCTKAVEGLYNKNIHDTVSILMGYYDKTYTHYRKKYNEKTICRLEFEKDDPKKNAQSIIESAEKNSL